MDPKQSVHRGTEQYNQLELKKINSFLLSTIHSKSTIIILFYVMQALLTFFQNSIPSGFFKNSVDPDQSTSDFTHVMRYSQTCLKQAVKG